MEPFATLDELQNRLDWTMDEGEERVAESALEDASDLARAYGRVWWDETLSMNTAPRLIRTLVLKACARYMKNYQGYTQSKAGDESVMWSDAAGADMGTVHFTKDEIKMIESLAGRRTAVISAPIVAWKISPVTDQGYVPDGTPAGKDFPMFQAGELLP